MSNIFLPVFFLLPRTILDYLDMIYNLAFCYICYFLNCRSFDLLNNSYSCNLQLIQYIFINFFFTKYYLRRELFNSSHKFCYIILLLLYYLLQIWIVYIHSNHYINLNIYKKTSNLLVFNLLLVRLVRYKGIRDAFIRN